MKAVFLALLYAASVEWLMYRFASMEYSASIETGLTVVAFIGAIPVGMFARRPLMAYFAGLALGAPVVSYSMLGYGLLEMGGLFHAMTFGIVGVVAYEVAHRFKRFRVQK